MTHRIGPALLLVALLVRVFTLADAPTAAGATQRPTPSAPAVSTELSHRVTQTATVSFRASPAALDRTTLPSTAPPIAPPPSPEPSPLPLANVSYGPDSAHRLDIHP
ncbi:MAG: hypothetical protein ACERLM_17540, partial [Acidimicrobiales bacterium]